MKLALSRELLWLKTICSLYYVSIMWLAYNSYFPKGLGLVSIPTWLDAYPELALVLMNACSVLILIFLLINFVRKSITSYSILLFLLCINVYLDLNKLSGQYFVNFCILTYCLNPVMLKKRKGEGRHLAIFSFGLYAAFFIWAGIFKFNANYMQDISPWFLNPLKNLLSLPSSIVNVMSYTSPFVEIFIPILFYFKRTRICALVLALSLHAVISYSLWIYDIYPPLVLNFQFMAFAVFFFFNLPNMKGLNILSRQTKVFLSCVALFPALSFVNLYPDEISFHTFSGRVKEVSYFTKHLRSDVDESFLKHTAKLEEGYQFDSLKWTLYDRAEEFNNTASNIKRLCYRLQKHWSSDQNIELRVEYLDSMWDSKRSELTVSCTEFSKLKLPYFSLID
ncbi:MAG: hypothetical protein KC478_16040 [Bacteriovoracaceae bacterium]|nr:hypothetical protein [Bacteriovoracaceae bacterium]